MLNIEIRLYASDNVGGKYNTSLLSHEDDAVSLAIEMFELEYFKVLERYLDYVSEEVGGKINTSPFLTKDYFSEVFGRIFKRFRENSEKYEKWLDYELQYNLECDSELRKLGGVPGKPNFTQESIEKELLEKYSVRYAVLAS